MIRSDRILGYFPREAAPVPETFTGERMTAAMTGAVEVEHYHRYLFARAFCDGRDVLDVASGEGYGSAQIAQIARSVVGVEYAGSTARHARASFPRDNLHYVQGDARSLPLADDSVDVVVSFETIEHFAGQDDFLREVRRVLRPGGQFIVSTADRDSYSPLGHPTNAFHVREVNRREFEAMLGAIFPHMRLVSQRAFIGSALLADEASSAPPLVFERRGDRFEACTGLSRAPYLIAVASDVPVSDLPPSLYLSRPDIDTDAWRAAEALRRLEAATAELASTRADAEARVADAEEATRLAQRDAAQARAEAATAAAELATATEAHAAALAQADARALALMVELDRLGGSARTFLRGYVPRLWRRG